jgi:hypothetical protein
MSEFDIFAHRPIHTSVLWTVETLYKTIATVDQNGLESFIHSESIPTQIYITNHVRGKLVSDSGKEVDLRYTNAVANYILLSRFSQCNVTVNGTDVTQTNEHSNYRSYLETLLNYGTDAAASHLINTYWYLDTVPMVERSLPPR